MNPCEHCGTPFTPRASGSRFCCHGCEYVAGMIHQHGFDRYYELKRGQVGAPVRSRPFEEQDFSWLPPLLAAAEADRAPRDLAELDCRVEGISCIGCVWLIGRLFEGRAGAVRAAGDPAGGLLHLEWQSGRCDVAGFLRDLSGFGYRAGPPGDRPDRAEHRQLTGRLGLCGAFALNAMAFSLPTYLGMPPAFEFAGLFRTIAFASATLAMLAGGGYFISRAWRAVQAGVLHIDLPISLGLLAAYAGSLVGWLGGHETLVYFDFVSTFVFLMLAGRVVQTAAVARNRLQLVRHSPLPREVPTAGGTIALAQLEPGTRFRLEPGQALPVTACLAEGIAEVSLEWIHGEAEPVTFRPGGRLPAGAILLSREPVEVTADESWADSLLAKLLTRGGDSISPGFQRLLKVYLALVLLIGIATFSGWGLRGNWLIAGQAMISVFVVSCPCALGVAVPLADEIAASRLARSGAFVRRVSLWPRLRRVRHVIFDKTGTLTLERPELENPAAVAALDDDAALALARLTRGSLHPVSRALLEALGRRGQQLLADRGAVPVVERPGEGVGADCSGARWFLGKSLAPGITELRREDRGVAAFTFRDTLRPEALRTLALLRRRGLSLHILSGDDPAKVARLARSLDIPAGQASGGLSPQEKATQVARLDRRDTLYLGDGANDSLAFDAAFVSGTPVVDRSFLETKADFYSLGSGLAYLGELFAAADARVAGVRSAFVFALLYNLGAVALSVLGRMNPLLAAVLMPLSSIVSILLVTTAGRSGRARDASPTSPDRPPPRHFSSPTHESGEPTIRSHAA